MEHTGPITPSPITPSPITPPAHVPPPRRKRPRLIWRILGMLFTASVLVFLLVSGAVAYFLWSYSKDLPDYEVLARYSPAVMTRIHANDGSLIAEYAKERRIYVPINAIPDRVIKAFLAAEDKNFFKHGGLDFEGLTRAVIVNLQGYFGGGDKRLIGASTITQQVAKNFLLTSERSIERKIKEAILAIRIERAFPKEKILELYLNEIYLGLKSYGVAAAALNYYGKSLEELTIGEAAYLAGLPKAPNNYHPFRKKKRALARRKYVLERMLANGFITNDEFQSNVEKPLNVNPRPIGAHIFAADFFAEEVRRELFSMYGEKELYGGGMSVRTTLNPVYQRMARKALVEGLVRYDRRHGWRGVQQQIDVAGDWGASLADIDVWSDIKPWRLAVVLEVSAKEALVGLRPTKLKNGKVADQRDTGIVPLSQVTWARPKRAKGLGPKPKAVSDVLKQGDVIYVAPIEPSSKKSKKKQEPQEGHWRLMQIPEVEGAIVVMDPHTGRVHALVGGFSYAESQFDRVYQAKRQPGSAFKPFVYVAALENGYTPASIVLDAPIAIEQGAGKELWKPQNYGKRFYGPSTLRLGIEKSRNLMTVRLAQDVGMPIISEYADRFGIYDNLLPVLSMSLGAGETTLVRLTTAYSVLANGGKKVKATLIDRIQDRFGRTVWRHDDQKCDGCRATSWEGQDEPLLEDRRRQIIDPHSAYQMTSMLQGVVLRGTATGVKAIGRPVAGKTGTTNDEKDAWFVGYTPDLAIGVFVGFDSPKPMGKGETGGKLASPIFRDFVKMALGKQPPVPFRVPPGINLIRINAKTGVRAQASGKNNILEAFKPNTKPPDFVPYFEEQPLFYDGAYQGPGDRQQRPYRPRRAPRAPGDLY